MKKSVVYLITLLINISIVSAQGIYTDLDQFFSKNVENGLVNYNDIQKNQTEELNRLINQVEKAIVNSNKTQKKALYINQYNLLVIQQIISNYPSTSPMQIAGFFDKTKFSIDGNQTTLNELENKIIRPTFTDNRVHFALVCGAIGCPPLQAFAYRPDTLDNQLNTVTKAAINNNAFIKKTEGKAEISELFRWYIDDFGKSEKGIKTFINSHIEGAKIESITYYPYDWKLNDKAKQVSTSNLATYTPSVLLKHKQIEVQIFNNLYTQTAWRDQEGIRRELNGRETYNTMLFTFNYGVSKSSRFNLGLDVNLRSVRKGPEDSKSIEVFNYVQDANNRTTISTLGPKIKWNPSKKIPKLSVQSSFLIPISDSLENKSNRPWLDYDRYTWWTQFFYDKPIGSKFQLFLEADLLFRIPKFIQEADYSLTTLSTPLSAFVSYFPSPKSTVYVNYQYAPTITSFPDYFMQGGIGFKYQVLSKLQVELSYTNFFASQNNGAGSTYNIGLRYIR